MTWHAACRFRSTAFGYIPRTVKFWFPLDQVQVGDTIAVRLGGLIPVDGGHPVRGSDGQSGFPDR